ncbi:unnamed protein product [Hydatigera taeniaeformis]|uniref:RNase H domain-containing protein n=1 Tax=Hydatigena taeniaeformis TaxID=6205 RepID=A0A0R3WM60_HYDTA|nr:unnamed protein product [Hydatigera taeniaeformis]
MDEWKGRDDVQACVTATVKQTMSGHVMVRHDQKHINGRYSMAVEAMRGSYGELALQLQMPWCAKWVTSLDARSVRFVLVSTLIVRRNGMSVHALPPCSALIEVLKLCRLAAGTHHIPAFAWRSPTLHHNIVASLPKIESTLFSVNPSVNRCTTPHGASAEE